MFFVVSGEVAMYRSSKQGDELVLQRATHGFVAEASLTSTKYHCDARCRIDTQLLAFPIRSLKRAIDEDQATRWAWVSMLDSQVRQQRAQIERFSLKTVRERLLHLLVTAGQNGILDISGTKMALAAELGVTHEALYRTLARLKKEGMVDSDNHRLWLTASRNVHQ